MLSVLGVTVFKPTSSPSANPTLSPSITQMPTTSPTGTPSSNSSHSPTDQPKKAPTRVCLGDQFDIEVVTEGPEFNNEVTWNIRDLYGRTISESFNNGGHETTYSCAQRNNCYTFTIHDSIGFSTLNEDEHRGLFTIKLDDNVAYSGKNFHTDYHVMFGDSCLDMNNTACSDGDNGQEFMLRLELVGDLFASWTLLDSNENVIRSAGPFVECQVNTLATCLPLECYKFVTTNNAGDSSEPIGQFTVQFIGIDGSLQSYTGDFSPETQPVFLGSCYELNFA